jgi:hypothetical protein
MVDSMDGKKILFFTFFVSLFSEFSPAFAANIELSGMVAYGRSSFSDGYNSIQRRYTGSIDFKFTPVSALQVEYTDSTTKISFPVRLSNLFLNPSYVTESTTFRDKIYSFNWVQNLVPMKWLIQPYVIFGGGKMQRNLLREYPELGISDTVTQSVANGTAGVGLRIFLTKNMAIKGEAKTYVPKFQFSKYKENQMFSVGVSWLL